MRWVYWVQLLQTQGWPPGREGEGQQCGEQPLGSMTDYRGNHLGGGLQPAVCFVSNAA